MANLQAYLNEMTFEELRNLVTELNCWNGLLEHLEMHYNDEEFFETFFSNKPAEAVRAASYGEYNYGDDYVKFNGYGNLVSMNKYEYEDTLTDSLDEIIEALKENIDNIDVDMELEILVRMDSVEIKVMSKQDFLDEYSLLDMNLTRDSLVNNGIDCVAVSESISAIFEEMESVGEAECDLYLVDGEYIALYV